MASSAISIDSQTLLLGLRYRHFVILRRVRRVVICIWVIGVSCGEMRLWNYIVLLGLHSLWWSYFPHNLDLFLHEYLLHTTTTAIPNPGTCQPIQGRQNRGEDPQNVARYRKTVSSIVWVQWVLVASYLPYFIMSIIILYYACYYTLLCLLLYFIMPIFRLTMTSNRRLIEVFFLATVT